MGLVIDLFEKSKYAYLTAPAQQSGVPQPALAQPVPENVSVIPLPVPSSISTPSMDVRTAMENRITRR